MVPLDVFGSESVAADLLQQVRWRDGSRRIETFQKTASHNISERSNSDENSTTNLEKKRSNTLSKQLSEINNIEPLSRNCVENYILRIY